MKKLFTFLIVAALLLSFAACGVITSPSASASSASSSAASSFSGQVTIPGLTEENYPMVGGSTANIPLLAALYSGVCGTEIEQAEAIYANISGTAAAWGSMLFEWQEPMPAIIVAYEAPGDLQTQINALAPPLEIQEIGLDALVFLVSADNPIDSLTTEELLGIYTGEITDWAEVGGTPGEIYPFQRNYDSGSQTMFLKLLMNGKEPTTPPTELVAGGMMGLIEQVANYNGTAGGIGFSVYYYAETMAANPGVKIIKVNGVAPTNETIQNGAYPFINPFFVAIRSTESSGSPARLLYNYLTGEEAKALLTATGYVPVAA